MFNIKYMLPNSIDVKDYPINQDDIKLIKDEIIAGNQLIEKLFYNYVDCFETAIKYSPKHLEIYEDINNLKSKNIIDIPNLRNDFLGIEYPLF